MHNIIEDIKKRLKIDIQEEDIHSFSEGSTEAKVFSIKDKYLVKCSTRKELNVYFEFLARYQSEYFQKLYFINYELGYICLSFIKGDKYKNNLDINYLIKSLYDITSNYEPIGYKGFGYLFEDHKPWLSFLADEVIYSKEMLDEEIDITIVEEALKTVSNYEVDPYLLHGDFGTHNFIINNNKLYVIDPMGLVGDPIYDFYFAIFSNVNIFTQVKQNDLLRYFNKDIKYKKAMLIITFFIRLCRAYKYDKDNYPKYLEYYKTLQI